MILYKDKDILIGEIIDEGHKVVEIVNLQQDTVSQYDGNHAENIKILAGKLKDQ